MDSSSSSCSSGRLRCQTSLQVNLTVCGIPEKWCRFTVQTANGPENQTRVSFKDVHASFLNSMSSTPARQQFEKWKINNHKTIFMCCWYPRWKFGPSLLYKQSCCPAYKERTHVRHWRWLHNPLSMKFLHVPTFKFIRPSVLLFTTSSS